MCFARLFRELLIGSILAIVVLGGACAPAAEPITGDWFFRAPMSVARSSPFVVAVDGMLYVAGGHNPSQGHSLAVLERYNPTTNSWTTLAPMPSARYKGGVAALNGKIYVIGGWNYPASTLPTSTVQIYDIATNAWSLGPAMPILSGSGPTGVINGRIYKHTAEHGFSSASRQFHVLDPMTGVWSALPDLPIDHGETGAGIINGKFHVGSGWAISGLHARTDAYDPATNVWSSGKTGPRPRGAVATAVFENLLLLVGGYDGANSTIALFESYDVSTDTWSTLPSALQPFNAGGAAVIGDVLYVAGGSDGGNPLNSLLTFKIVQPLCPAETLARSLGIPLPLGLLRQFRDEFLAVTDDGRDLIALYERHGDEIKELLASHPRLALTTAGLLLEAQTALAVLPDNGGVLLLDAEFYERSLDHLAECRRMAQPGLEAPLARVETFLRTRSRRNETMVMIDFRRTSGSPVPLDVSVRLRSGVDE